MESVHSLFVLLAFRPRELIFFFFPPQAKLSASFPTGEETLETYKFVFICLVIIRNPREPRRNPVVKHFSDLHRTCKVDLPLHQENPDPEDCAG